MRFAVSRLIVIAGFDKNSIGFFAHLVDEFRMHRTYRFRANGDAVMLARNEPRQNYLNVLRWWLVARMTQQLLRDKVIVNKGVLALAKFKLVRVPLFSKKRSSWVRRLSRGLNMNDVFFNRTSGVTFGGREFELRFVLVDGEDFQILRWRWLAETWKRSPGEGWLARRRHQSFLIFGDDDEFISNQRGQILDSNMHLGGPITRLSYTQKRMGIVAGN